MRVVAEGGCLGLESTSSRNRSPWVAPPLEFQFEIDGTSTAEEGKRIMKTNILGKALFLMLWMGIVCTPGMANDIQSTSDVDSSGIQLDDDLKAIQDRFNAELKRIQTQFAEEVTRIQSSRSEELNRAHARIASLEAENDSLRKALAVARVQLGERVVAASNDATPAGRGQLGIEIVEINAAQARSLEVKASEAVLVEGVQKGSTADQMGIRVGDAITEIDDKDADLDTLIDILSGKKAGQSVTIEWARKSDDGILRVTGRGVMKPWQDPAQNEVAVEVVVESIPAVRLVEPAPPAPDPVVERSAGISLGINVVQAEQFGLEVVSVTADSNAAVLGLEVGDHITHFGDAQIRTIEGLRDVLATTVPGVETQVRFLRKGNDSTQGFTATIRFGGDGLAPVLASVEADGRDQGSPAADAAPGFLGVAPIEKSEGVFVEEVIPGSCAERMALQVGDRLFTVAGKQILTIDDLRQALAGRKAGQQITIQFVRSGSSSEAGGVLGKYPSAEGQSSIVPQEPSKTVSAPITAASKAESPRSSGKLGIIVAWDADGAVIEAVLPGSGAGEAGARIGDRIVTVDGMAVTTLDEIGEILASVAVGAPIPMEVIRGGEIEQLVAQRPSAPAMDATVIAEVVPSSYSEPPVLGIEVEENAIGILLTDVHEGSLAQEAGLQQGDWIIRICEMEVRSIEDIQDSLQYTGLAEIQVTVRRDLEILQLTIPILRR